MSASSRRSDRRLGGVDGGVDDDYLTGHLRFGKAQHGLLAMLVCLVGLIAAIGYQSSLVVSEQTEALNDQLQLVSGNMVSLERQVLTQPW